MAEAGGVEPKRVLVVDADDAAARRVAEEARSYGLWAATVASTAAARTAISERRPNYQLGQAKMQEVCLKCHTRPRIDEFYQNAEAVIESTNARVRESQTVMKQLYDEKLLTPQPLLRGCGTACRGACVGICGRAPRDTARHAQWR